MGRFRKYDEKLIEKFNNRKQTVWNKIHADRFDEIIDPVEIEIYNFIMIMKSADTKRDEIIQMLK